MGRHRSARLGCDDTLPPVGKLPVEVLNRIFRWASVGDPPVYAPGHVRSSPGWYSVTWVCWHWRHVALTDAVLWARNYSHNHSTAAAALQRAGNVPLDYRLTADIPKIPLELNMDSYGEAADLFALNTPLERCRTIVVQHGRGDVVQHICRLASLAAHNRLPVLEQLHLSNMPWNWGGQGAKILVGNIDRSFTIFANKLRLLRLHNCYAAVDTPALQTYCLAFTSFLHPRPLVQVLYRDLAPLSGGSLSRLELDNAVLFDLTASDVFAYTQSPLYFPHLRRVRIRGNTAQVAALLRLIKWPSDHVLARIRVATSNSPTHSLVEQKEILNLLFPKGNSWRIFHIQRTYPNPMSSITAVGGWDFREYPVQKNTPHAQVVFEGGSEVCSWWHTAKAALKAFGPGDIEIFSAAMCKADYLLPDAPWADILTSMPNLRALSPFDRIMESLGPVQEGHVLGKSFREKVTSVSQYKV